MMLHSSDRGAAIISISYMVILQSSAKLNIFVCRHLPIQNCNSSLTPLKTAGVITPYQLDSDQATVTCI